MCNEAFAVARISEGALERMGMLSGSISRPHICRRTHRQSVCYVNPLGATHVRGKAGLAPVPPLYRQQRSCSRRTVSRPACSAAPSNTENGVQETREVRSFSLAL